MTSERNTVSSSYRESGVDVQAGYDAVRLMRGHVERTMTSGVIGGLGGFGGMFALPEGMKSPVLVSGTDGVGTKLKIAFAMNRHNTVGVD
ncbi:MAG: phosphoribosylformylglycinamidine cyclo-ligase, partial [Synergistaceae bacterium]|nr:phosphoribosylformylglycinamidine cyclo-ligase [Synergistaceae bacterium]